MGPTKTYARRSVGIPRSLCDDLAAYFAERTTSAGRPLDPNDYVFTAPRGGPLRRDLLFKRFVRPAIELGAHPKAIQERLGHSSITVTMDVYGHLFPALNEALTDRLDDVFRSARALQGSPNTSAIVALPTP